MQDNRAKNETELLEMFTAEDGVRAFMYILSLHPVYNEVWATNEHVIIGIRPDRLNRHYEPIKGREKLKPPEVLKPCHLSCIYKAIRQALDACPLASEVVTGENEEDCKEYGGTGEIEWEYTDDNLHKYYHDFDCSKCGGDGVIEHKLETHIGKKVHDENAIVEIGDATLRWYYLDTVARALKHVGADVIDITANDHFRMTEFVSNGIRVRMVNYHCSEGEGFNEKVGLKENNQLNK